MTYDDCFCRSAAGVSVSLASPSSRQRKISAASTG